MHRYMITYYYLVTIRPSGAGWLLQPVETTGSKLSPLRCYFHQKSAPSMARPSGLYTLPTVAACKLDRYTRTIPSSSTYYTLITRPGSEMSSTLPFFVAMPRSKMCRFLPPVLPPHDALVLDVVAYIAQRLRAARGQVAPGNVRQRR